MCILIAQHVFSHNLSLEAHNILNGLFIAAHKCHLLCIVRVKGELLSLCNRLLRFNIISIPKGIDKPYNYIVLVHLVRSHPFIFIKIPMTITI